MSAESCIYHGQVVHKRLRPKPHALSYRVFAMYLDCDALGDIASRLRLFSHNRWNLVSFHDADHGAGAGIPVAEHARQTLADAGLAHAGARVFLLCYPRVLGYGFNPISVYYGFDTNNRLGAAIYEVNNTFGERRSYVVPIDDAKGAAGPHAHGCAKELYVSPFTDMRGRYGFRLSEPGKALTLGVSLRDDDGPLLKTHFRGDAQPLTDTMLARLLASLPLLTLKITAAIHYEALRLWLKGVPLTVRPKAPRYAVTHVPAPPPVPLVVPARDPAPLFKV
jgi:uncharacterized protein